MKTPDSNNEPKSFSILLGIVYEETLKSVQTSFPQYIRELEGVADGAQVEFYKVPKPLKNLRRFQPIQTFAYVLFSFQAFSASHGRYYSECYSPNQWNESTYWMFDYLRERS